MQVLLLFAQTRTMSGNSRWSWKPASPPWPPHAVPCPVPRTLLPVEAMGWGGSCTVVSLQSKGDPWYPAGLRDTRCWGRDAACCQQQYSRFPWAWQAFLPQWLPRHETCWSLWFLLPSAEKIQPATQSAQTQGQDLLNETHLQIICDRSIRKKDQLKEKTLSVHLIMYLTDHLDTWFTQPDPWGPPMQPDLSEV